MQRPLNQCSKNLPTASSSKIYSKNHKDRFEKAVIFLEKYDFDTSLDILEKLEPKDAIEVQHISSNRHEEEPELLNVDKNYEEC